jgi:phosphatidate cytidylyltransferase
MALPGRRLEGTVVAVGGAVLPLIMAAGSAFNGLLLLTALVLVLALLRLFRFAEVKPVTGEVSTLAFGLLYVPLLLSFLALLRNEPQGVHWIFLLLLVVMAGDSTAYYVGSSCGRHKLYPTVSPNKSIEGALGGLVGSVGGAFIAKATFFPDLSVVDCLLAATAMGLLGQLGDLFESLLKRSCGVKDSGGIVPGHGGILDRLDSILFAAPVAYCYAHYFFQTRL